MLFLGVPYHKCGRMGPKTLFELLGPLYDVDPYMFISQMAVGEKPPDITSMSCLRLLEATRIQAQPSHFVFLFRGFCSLGWKSCCAHSPQLEVAKVRFHSVSYWVAGIRRISNQMFLAYSRKQTLLEKRCTVCVCVCPRAEAGGSQQAST